MVPYATGSNDTSNAADVITGTAGLPVRDFSIFFGAIAPHVPARETSQILP